VTEPTGPRIDAAPAGVRQRWRLVYRRAGGAAAVLRTQREELQAWEGAIAAGGIPAVGLDGPSGRPRIQLGPPLATGIPGDHELADLFLTRRVTSADLRGILLRSLPPGITLVDLHDVWPGAPALPVAIVAADYGVELAPAAPGAVELTAAARYLLDAHTLPRERSKGGGVRRYDLRPLLAAIEVLDPGPPIVLRIRTRLDPQLGSGRPEEVLAALGELAGGACTAADLRRERLILADDA
jgi:radical SAM-linked protein